MMTKNRTLGAIETAIETLHAEHRRTVDPYISAGPGVVEMPADVADLDATITEAVDALENLLYDIENGLYKPAPAPYAYEEREQIAENAYYNRHGYYDPTGTPE